MQRSRRLLPIRRLAEHAELKEAQGLARSQQQLRTEQDLLGELLAYKQQYVNEFKSIHQQRLNIDKLTHIQLFIAQLEDTIRAQQTIIQRRERELAKQKEIWQQRHVRTESLDKVIERFQQVEQQQEHKNLQKILDEGASQRYKGSS